MLTTISDTTIIALFGLFGGIALGLAARLGRFCTLGAIEDAFFGGNDLRFRMWGIAIGVSIIGTFVLVGTGGLTLSETVHLGQSWNPAASILGGLVFGYGMALSGNCGFGALARLGGGDLRSFVIVLTMGLASYMTLSGPFASLRVWLFPMNDPGADLPSVAIQLSRLTGFSPTIIGLSIGATVLAFSAAPIRVRNDTPTLFWGTFVGLIIVSGWAGTQWIANIGFGGTRVVSHTFSAPIGETMLYAMTASGNSLSFGVGSVAGVLAGAFIASLIRGHFRWEACEDPRELQRQIVGAFLMGVGAVTALGCSVGQGLSAFSVLAVSAPVTLAAIVAGAVFGLRQLIVGFSPAE
jgi:uncharacterized protein